MKKKISSRLVRAAYVFVVAVSAIYLTFTLLRVFCFATYSVPTESMEPTILPGEKIFVEKLSFGPRLFPLSGPVCSSDISRLGDCSSVRRGDVVVFNNPFPHGWGHIRFDQLKYYVKRCIALPGDTLSISAGRYHVSGLADTLGRIEAQILLGRMTRDSLRAERYGISMRSFPRDRRLGWTVREFGPLYVPQRGDSVLLDHQTMLLYGKLIEWERETTLSEADGRVFDADSLEVKSHVFCQNYYFMGGDNMSFSLDSRYWGLVPEDFIAGRALCVWWSRDPVLGSLRMERFFTRL